MREFTVIAYEKENGEVPVEDFLNSYEGQIILTNGFVKKTQKTPPSEIELADGMGMVLKIEFVPKQRA